MSGKPQDPAKLATAAAALRLRAQTQSHAMELPAPVAQTPAESQQLLEELRVYQIELEMQNENLRRAQFQLEKERDKYFHQFDLAPVGYLTLNDRGIIDSANLTAAHLLGVERHLVVGQPFSAFFFPADRDASYLYRRALGNTGKPQSCELRLQRASGDAEEPPGHFWALIESRPSPTAGTEAPDFWVTFADITDRKTAEERLGRYHGRIRALNAELVVSEQRERNRLGVELHDGVGHLLAAAKMTAQMLVAEPMEVSAKTQVEKLVVLLGEAMGEVRHLTSELAPTVLFELGLRSSLLWLRDRYGQLYGLRCTVRVDRHAAQSRTDAAMFVFRVAREALNNVVRHSHVDRAILTVRESDGWITVIIRDSGEGFDTAPVDEPGGVRGFGLFSIREQCLEMGGTMEIESRRGKGTTIKVRVPDEAAK